MGLGLQVPGFGFRGFEEAHPVQLVHAAASTLEVFACVRFCLILVFTFAWL